MAGNVCRWYSEKYKCTKDARYQIRTWMAGKGKKNPISPYMRKTVYDVALRNQDNSEFYDFFKKQHTEAKKNRYKYHGHFKLLNNIFTRYFLHFGYDKRPDNAKIIMAKKFVQHNESVCAHLDTDLEDVDENIGQYILDNCKDKIKQFRNPAKKIKQLIEKIALNDETELITSSSLRFTSSDYRKEVILSDEEVMKILKEPPSNSLACIEKKLDLLDKFLPK